MSYLNAPVHDLQDFQLEYGGLLLGVGTSYYLPPDGSWKFFDAAAIKTMDQARTWADGSYSGPDFADVLLPDVTIQVSAATPDAFAQLVQTFRNSFGPQSSPLPLWVKVPSLPAFGIGAKVNKRSLPMTNTWSTFAEGSLQWRCPDPQWQSVPRIATLTGSASAASGLTFPLFAPASGPYTAPGSLDFGSLVSSSSSAVLTNAGNTPAWPVVTLFGPGPSFTITIDGNTVTYSQPIAVGQSVTIDYKSGLATLTGGVDRTTALTSRQFSPVTSSSSVFLTATTGSATVAIADIWR